MTTPTPATFFSGPGAPALQKQGLAGGRKTPEETLVLPDGQGEHDLFWLPLAEAERAFFHESHAWAAHQGLERSTEGPRE